MANSAQEVMGFLGGVQTLCEKFPLNFKLNYINFPTSFDFMIDILKLCHWDNKKLVKKVAEKIADDSPGGFLNAIEVAVKTVLKLNISKMLTCEANPFIPDTLIGPSVGDSENGYKQTFENEPFGVNALHGGFDIDIATIDTMGYLRNAPLSEVGKNFYFDCDYKVNNLYQSTDFNVFLWYVINKGMTAPEFERKKLIWDNRVRVKLMERDEDYRLSWFMDTNKDKRKIIDISYIDNGTTATNKLNIKINPETYYRSRKTKKSKFFNKTIFEFNNDYLNSMKLLHRRPIIANITDVFTGGNLTFSAGISLDEQIIMGQVDKIIKNVVEADDTEISDCYFSFSNDEFNAMLEESEMRMMGKMMMNGNTNQTTSYNQEELLASLDKVSSAANQQEVVSSIENLFFDIAATPAKEGSGSIGINPTFGYDSNLLSLLIRAIIYPIVKVVLSPKVLLMFQVNGKIMGNTPPDPMGILSSFFVIIKNVIKMVKDLLIEMFLEFVIETLKPILELFASKLFLEMLEEYRTLLKIMLDCLFWFKTNKILTAIDDVNYADIDVPKVAPDDTKC
jgi:hypothetical protein